MRIHGDRDVHELRSLGLLETPLLDFSVNLNPFGPPPFMVSALQGANVIDYPDRRNETARAALASTFNVALEHVAVGNGACELLWSLARLWAGGNALMVEPTFSEFAAAMQAEGGTVVEFRSGPDTGFGLDLKRLSDALTEKPPDVVYLCNPNNPTGTFTDVAALNELAAAHPRVAFIVDESFLSLCDHHSARFVPCSSANLLRVRSLTKDFSVAGIRVGYVIGAPSWLAPLEARRPPWTVNAFADAAVLASLSGESFLEQSRSKLRTLRNALTRGLRDLGLEVTSSTVNFMVAHIPRGGTALRRALLERHHIVVRDASSFGLPHHIRLCVRPEPDIERLLRALPQAL